MPFLQFLPSHFVTWSQGLVPRWDSRQKLWLWPFRCEAGGGASWVFLCKWGWDPTSQQHFHPTIWTILILCNQFLRPPRCLPLPRPAWGRLLIALENSLLLSDAGTSVTPVTEHSWVEEEVHRGFLWRSFTNNPVNVRQALAFTSQAKLLLQEGACLVCHSLISFTSLEKPNGSNWLCDQGYEKWSRLENDLQLQSDLPLESGEMKRDTKNFYLFGNTNIWNCVASCEIPRLANWGVILQHREKCTVHEKRNREEKEVTDAAEGANSLIKICV